jgi:hypothetical protein
MLGGHCGFMWYGLGQTRLTYPQQLAVKLLAR